MIASILFVIVAGLLLLALHFVTLIVIDTLNRASDSKNSPFAYFGSLFGLVVVVAKLIYALLVHPAPTK